MDRWRDLTEATISPPFSCHYLAQPRGPQTPPPWCRQKREAGAGGAMPVCCNPVAPHALSGCGSYPTCRAALWNTLPCLSACICLSAWICCLLVEMEVKELNAISKRWQSVFLFVALLFYKGLVPFHSQSFEWKGSIVLLLHCMIMNYTRYRYWIVVESRAKNTSMKIIRAFVDQLEHWAVLESCINTNKPRCVHKQMTSLYNVVLGSAFNV